MSRPSARNLHRYYSCSAHLSFIEATFSIGSQRGTDLFGTKKALGPKKVEHIDTREQRAVDEEESAPTTSRGVAVRRADE